MMLYRLAEFNKLAHNRDNHFKNFGFLMYRNDKWTLLSAYDLTCSSGFGGEQSTMVIGEGRTLKAEYLLLAKEANIKKDCAFEIIKTTCQLV